jgi:hypothetical protein
MLPVTSAPKGGRRARELPPAALSAREGRPRRGGRLVPQPHPGLSGSAVALALIAAATGRNGVEPGVPAAAGAGQDVVDGCGMAAAVAAAATVAPEHTSPGPGRAGVETPAGHDVPDEAHHPWHRVHADELVRFGFVDFRHAAHEHAYRVAETDPVERAEVGVDDQDVHRIPLFRVVHPLWSSKRKRRPIPCWVGGLKR